MYKISEFAAVCGTTTKTIRFYDSAGVLEADYIDPSNGYRYYKSDKIQQYYKIISLKQIGFTIEEIKTQFLNADDGTVLAVLKEKENKLLQAYQSCKEIIIIYEEKIKMLNENQSKKVTITCENNSVILDDGNNTTRILCAPTDVDNCKNVLNEILNTEGFVRVSFDDVASLVNSVSPVEIKSYSASGGDNRAINAVEHVIPSDKNVQALIMMKMSPDSSLSEIESACLELSNNINADSTIIWGAGFMDNCEKYFEITAVYFA